MIAQPLAQVAIFAFVLSGLLSARVPGVTGPHAYVIYLMAGTLCWSLFADVVSRCLTIFIDNGNLIKKISFPRVTLPVIVVGIALVNNAFLFAALMIGAVLLGHWPGLALVWLVPLSLLTLALATGFGVVLGVINVFVRDTAQAVSVVLQALYWLTPIVYMTSILPERYRNIPELNPLTPLVAAYQAIFLTRTSPDWPSLVPVLFIAVGMLFVSLTIFRRAGPEMADVL